MDYGRELNQYISSNPGVDVAVCQDKLRKWRKFGSNCSMLDLKKAYLQLYVDDELLKFQAVRYIHKLNVCHDQDGFWTQCCSKDHVKSSWQSPVYGKCC